MNDILRDIDNTLATVTACLCGCGTRLGPTSTSPWYANESCMRIATRAVTGADRYPHLTGMLSGEKPYPTPEQERHEQEATPANWHELHRDPWYRRWLRFGRRPGTPA